MHNTSTASSPYKFPVTDCLYHPIHSCNCRFFRIFLSFFLPFFFFFSTECMDFATKTFRIETNFFCKRDLYLFQRIQTGFWCHPALYSVGPETASPGDYLLIRSRCYSQADNPWLCREMNSGLA